MRIDQRFLNWGLFFILLGAVPLAVQQGLVAESVVDDWWRLWPLLIVGAGVGLLLRRTPVAFLGGLTVAATFGLMLGGLLAGGSLGDFGDFACGSGRSTAPFETRQGNFTGSSAGIELDLNCGDINLSTGPGDGWALAGRSSDGAIPNIDASNDRLTIRSRDFDRDGWFGFGDRDTWDVTIPDDLGTELDATLNAGTGTFDLAGSAIERVSIEANAGDVRLDLTDTRAERVDLSINAAAGSIVFPSSAVDATLSVNAGSIQFCVPPETGLRISTNDNITAGNNFDDRGLSKSGTTWTSSDYSSATNRIEIDASANAASLELNPEEGCR